MLYWQAEKDVAAAQKELKKAQDDLSKVRRSALQN
jgi:hypothetical protein